MEREQEPAPQQKAPRLKLPPGCEGWRDRFGRAVYYYRPTKHVKRIRLPGLPHSPTFMAAYEAAKGGRPIVTAATEKARRILRGSFREGLVKYLGGPAFGALNQEPGSTGYRRRLSLENFCDAEGADGSKRGDQPIDLLDRHNLAGILNAMDSRHTATDTLKALRAMFEYLCDIDRDMPNPTLGCKIVAPEDTGGFYTWSEEDITKFAKHHSIGSLARLAMATFLYTGLRKSDGLKLGPQHLAKGRVRFTPNKTKKSSKFVLDMPVDPAFAATIKAHGKSGHMTLLVNPNTGQPYNPTTFSHWMRTWCDEAGLPDCTSHGLRKAICVRLANKGCTVPEIAAITGHKNWKVLQKYVDEYDRAKASDRAMAKLLAGDAAMAA